MPPPMNQNKAWEDLRKIIEDDKAILVSPIDGKLESRTQITYHCECGEIHSKVFSNIKNGGGGALCRKCSQKRGNERRIASLNNGPKWTINNGEIDFNRPLAEETVKKNGSTLLGIYNQNEDGSRIKIINDGRITRESYLHIRCPCGTEDFVKFRNAHGGIGIVEEGKGLCLCTACRKGHKSNVLRNTRRGIVDTIDIIESMTKRAERIEKEGQECTDCKEHKPSSEFFGRFNPIEKCKVYKGRCYPCSRKLRTSNRENTLRNSSIEDFMKAELVLAKDRNKKRGKNHEFDITVDFLMELLEKQDGLCAMSGIKMLTTTHRDERSEDDRVNPNKLSIDRIDSKRGYIQDNVQLVSCWVNLMKLDISIDVFKERCKLISSFVRE
jgi:hypothetical protein